MPKNLFRMLYRMIPDETRIGALQDFEAEYRNQAAEHNRFKAGLWLWGQMVLMLPSVVADHWKRSLSMLKSYLILAIRFMKKQRLFAIINMLCLSVGLAACIFALLYIDFELSHNRFHPHAERIFRLDSRVNMGGARWKPFNVVPMSVGPALTQQFPEVEEAARMVWAGRVTVQSGERRITESDITLTDPSFFTLFNFKVRQGSVQHVFQQPGQVVISERMSLKYFGGEDPIGQTLSWMPDGAAESRVYTVAAVLEDTPVNSYVSYAFLISLEHEARHYPRLLEVDDIGNAETFVRLAVGADPLSFLEKLGDFIPRHYIASLAGKRKFQFQSILEIYSGWGAERKMSLYSMMAAVLMVVAVFNYINLSMARSIKRYREVGMRKVMGASRHQLIVQFMGESIAFALGGLALGLMIVFFLLGWINHVAGIALSPQGFLNTQFLATALGLAILTGLFSGFYPALMLSKQRPAAVLSGQGMRMKKSTFPLAKLLIMLQFAISSFFVSTTIVSMRQVGFMRQTEIGATLEDRLSITLDQPVAYSKLLSVKNQLLKLKQIDKVSCASNTPTSLHSRADIFPKPLGGRSAFDALVRGENIEVIDCDEDFISILGLKLAGEAESVQGNALYLNEAAVHSFDEDVVAAPGMTVQYHTGDDVMRNAVIAGIVKNFHVMSKRFQIKPLALMPIESGDTKLKNMIVQTHAKSEASTFLAIQEVLDRLLPESQAQLAFLEDEWVEQNADEARQFNVGMGLALITALIAGLGLYGLAAFMLEQRTKEIGIRKVLGAKRSELLRLLGKTYFRWICIANGVALPVAFLYSKGFLSGFAYRISLNGVSFLGAFLFSVVLLGISIGVKVIGSARMNPVKTLSCE